MLVENYVNVAFCKEPIRRVIGAIQFHNVSYSSSRLFRFNSIGGTSCADPCRRHQRQRRGLRPAQCGTGQAGGTAARPATAEQREQRGQERSDPWFVYNDLKISRHNIIT